MEEESGFINNQDLQETYYNVYWNAIQGSDLAVEKKQIIAKAFNKFVKAALAFAEQYAPGTVLSGDQTDDLYRNMIYEQELLQDAVGGVPRDPFGNFNTWMVTEIPNHAFPELMHKLFTERLIPGTMRVADYTKKGGEAQIITKQPDTILRGGRRRRRTRKRKETKRKSKN